MKSKTEIKTKQQKIDGDDDESAGEEFIIGDGNDFNLLNDSNFENDYYFIS